VTARTGAAPSAEAEGSFGALVFTQVINLDRSPERLATVDRGLRRAGIAYERLPAVDGRQLDLATDPEVRRSIDREAWMRRHHRNPTAADIGCYLSHLRALDRLLDQPRPLGLILEDDADVAADFLAAVEPAVRDAASWDILKLHVRHPGPLIPRRVYREGSVLCSLVTRHAGATAYMVTKTAAAQMREHMVPAVKMNDWTYDEGHKMRLRVRTLAQPPVGLQSVASTIESDRGAPDGSLAAARKRRSWLERQTDRPLLPRWQLPFRRTADAGHRLWYNLVSDGGLRAIIGGPERP
jgi:glycosyl transferase family 25